MLVNIERKSVRKRGGKKIPIYSLIYLVGRVKNFDDGQGGGVHKKKN